MYRFNTAIASLVLILILVLLVSFMGAPRPDFKQASNRKSSVLPNENNILAYNQEGQWEIELGEKLATKQDLILESVEINTLKSFSNIKDQKSPVKLKRKKNKVFVILKDSFENVPSEIIVAVGVSKGEKRVAWKESYLVNLKPSNIFIDSSKKENQDFNPQNGIASVDIITPNITRETQKNSSITSERFFGIGKSTPTPSPSPEPCDIKIDSSITEGQTGHVFAYALPANSRITSARIYNVKAVHTNAHNVSNSTYMSFPRKSISGGIATFYTENAKWYGINKNIPREFLCAGHYTQSEYKAIVHLRFVKPNGVVCSVRKRHAYLVYPEKKQASHKGFLDIDPNTETRIANSSSRRCCVDINDSHSRIIKKRSVIENPFKGQYRQIVQQEEERHKQQFMGGLPWSHGGVGEEPTNERVYSHLSSRRYCSSRFLSTRGGSSALCSRAQRKARSALIKAARKAINEFTTWRDGNRCWVEYTAKRDIRWFWQKAFKHYECGYPDCPSPISQPPYLRPPNR